jgi:HAD superfamily hydrolase (TIGR01459 family)
VSGTTAIAGFGKLADAYDIYLVDQWGVLHDGHTAHAPAIDVMHRLKEDGKKLIILSNSSRRADTTRENMIRMAIDPDLFDGFATSGEEVWQAFRRRDNPFYASLGTRCIVFQWGHDEHFFEGLDLKPVESIEEAEFILLNGTERDRFPTYEAILRRGVERGLPMVCSNGDFVSITPEGELVQCPGIIARRYETLGGSVRWHGKPTPGAYQMALGDEPSNPKRILAIGDSLHHDIAGADTAGFDALFITDGIHRPELDLQVNGAHTAESLAKLYEQYGATPTYVARHLVW